MSHKTLISGTSYAIKGGTDLIAGTSYQIGGGRTLVNGTAYEVAFGPSEYIMTLSGSGGTIKYNGVAQTETFAVSVGASIEIIADAACVRVQEPQTAIIKLNGVTVASQEAFRPSQGATATYTYTPDSDAEIVRSVSRPNTGGIQGAYSTTINIKTA